MSKSPDWINSSKGNRSFTVHVSEISVYPSCVSPDADPSPGKCLPDVIIPFSL